MCGARCLAHADRRARAARSTRWAAAPRQPKHPTDLKVLPTDSTSGCPPLRSPQSWSPLCSVCGQSPHTMHLVGALASSPDTPPGQTARGAALGPRSYRGLPTSSPAWDPHKAQCAGLPTRSPRRRVSPSPSPVPKKGCISKRAEARPMAGARSRGGHSGAAGLSRRPRSRSGI